MEVPAHPGRADLQPRHRLQEARAARIPEGRAVQPRWPPHPVPADQDEAVPVTGQPPPRDPEPARADLTPEPGPGMVIALLAGQRGGPGMPVGGSHGHDRRRFRPPVVSMAASYRHPRATALSGQERYDHAWAGFRCEISSRWFRVAGRWLTGDWDCFILVRGHGVWRPARLHSPALGDAGRPGFLEPVPGLQVRPTWVGRHLHVGVMRTPARLAAVSRGGDDLILGVNLAPAAPGEAAPASAEFVLVRHG